MVKELLKNKRAVTGISLLVLVMVSVLVTVIFAGGVGGQEGKICITSGEEYTKEIPVFGDGAIIIANLTGINGTGLLGSVKYYNFFIEDSEDVVPVLQGRHNNSGGFEEIWSFDMGFSPECMDTISSLSLEEYDLRVILEQDTSTSQWEVWPQYRLVNGSWEDVCGEGSTWITSSGFNLTNPRVRIKIDDSSSGTLCFDGAEVFVEDIILPVIGIPTTVPQYPTCDTPNPIGVNVQITDDNGINHSRFNWQYSGSSYSYFMQPLIGDNDTWQTWLGIPSGDRADGVVVEYKVYATDIFGNENISDEGYLQLFVFDCAEPNTNLIIGDPNYNDSINIYVTSETPLNLTCSDNASGCNKTYYQINGGGWVEYSSPFTLSGSDGSYTVEYYSTDNAGFTETTKSQVLILDNSNPVVILQPLNQYYNSVPIILNFTYSDSGSGVREYFVYKQRLGIDSEFSDITPPSTPISGCTSPLDNGDGSYTVECSFVDGSKDGNFSFKIGVIDNLNHTLNSSVESTVLDRAKPLPPTLISPILEFLTTLNLINFEWIAIENTTNGNPLGSGVSGIDYSTIQTADNTGFSGPSLVSAATPLETFSYSFSEGTYYWRVRSTDNAGNIGDWSEIWNFTIDQTPPVINITNIYAVRAQSRVEILNGTTYVRGFVNVTVNVTDLNGVFQVNATIGGNESVCSPTTGDLYECEIYTREVADGPQVITVKAWDNAYNYAEASKNVSVDNTPPVTTLTIGEPNINETIVSPETPFTLDCTDNNIGCWRIYYVVRNDTGITVVPQTSEETDTRTFNLSGLPGGEYYTIRYRSRDLIRNTETWNSKTVYLDSGVTQIDILKPEPEEYIDTMGYIFKANVSDLSGISEVKMQLLNSTGDVVRNGTMIPNEEKPGQYEFGSDLILARGFYTVVVNATDGLGNKGGATRLTYLDYSIQVLDWEGIQTQIDADEGGTVIIEYTVAARGGNIMRFTMGYISTLSPFMMNATVSNGYGVAAVRDVFEDSQPLQIGPSGQDPIVSTFNLTLTFTNETVQALTPGESYPISYAVWLDVEVT